MFITRAREYTRTDTLKNRKSENLNSRLITENKLENRELSSSLDQDATGDISRNTPFLSGLNKKLIGFSC